ncbi:hypothetical protein KP509_33G008100 [Ceratopteris richardii]|uniref:PQ-loop repeat family protein / transmembrane family protein n=1 Tax=Ceratopteris richardii TaxID=49495 RepID=A0A8T2QN51_CERRI|nr:hypothetical protein KP509_33G008100 [Ceratopteris richardii]
MLAFSMDQSCGGRSTDGVCVEWVRRYLGDCVCSKRDAISFGVGLASVLCWGVAEVPQIVTNFRVGSTEGISVLFLITWVVGDAFNLIGCYLEPSTLPTQLYMALLYTLTTLILLGQVIYYDHYLKFHKTHIGSLTSASSRSLQRQPSKLHVDKSNDELEQKPTKAKELEQAVSQPILYSNPNSQERYYISARSLTSSHTPTSGSYLAACPRSSGGQASYPSLLHHHSVNVLPNSEPIPISLQTSKSVPVPAVASGSPRILRAVVSVGISIGGLNIGRSLMLAPCSNRLYGKSGSPRVFSQRKLLQLVHEEGGVAGGLGMWLGWMMAAIYMGGRLPQILLNIKRGSVEGLNPLMFTFALLGNATYVGSILIRSTEWQKIRSNMPWLVDAGVCVVLDFLILCQFIYYCHKIQRIAEKSSNGDYKSLA